MTKTLTEQWRDGELKDGIYYASEFGKNSIIVFFDGGYPYYDFNSEYEADDINEVLSAVPSYDEYQGLLSDQLAKNEAIEINAELEHKIERLQEQLTIATKALERIYQPSVGDIYNFETDELDNTKLQDIAEEALKEMEGVK